MQAAHLFTALRASITSGCNREMWRRFVGVTWLGIAALSPASVRADLQLKFDVTLVSELPARTSSVDTAKSGNTLTPRADEKPTTRHSVMTIVLGPDYFTMSDDEGMTLTDFAHRRTVRIDRKTKTYSSVSLFSNLGFRVAEFQNRLFLQGALAAGGMKDNPFDTVLIEHLFALRAPKSTALKPATDKPGLTFNHAGKPLCHCSPNGSPLSETEAAQFVRFLRYEFSMHPDILAAIEAQHRLPDEYEVDHYNMRVDHWRFKLVQRQEVPRAFDPERELKGLTQRTNPATKALAAAAAISREDFVAKCDGLIAAAKTAEAEGHHLDALLLAVEDSLSTGNQRIKTVFPNIEQVRADPNVQRFLQSQQVTNKESAQKAAEEMHALRDRVHEGVRVLKIHEANHLTAAGKPSDARQLFIEVLEENPCITGAWKDLGDLFYRDYDAETAWQCWDAGRHLVPDQPQFTPVRDFERQLAQDHPEFF
jgi:hypothetical protein